MDIVLLGITIVSLVVALVMSVTAWRLMRDEKQRSAARVAALSVAAATQEPTAEYGREPEALRGFVKAPWAPAPRASLDSSEPAMTADSLSLRMEAPQPDAVISHASGFLGASPVERDNAGPQKSLAFAAVILFAVMSGGLAWMMSGPEGTSAAAVGPNSPLELVSLTHARQNDKLAVSGLVRNPVNGKPVEHLSAVVFLFDRMGTFVTSSRANVDFLNLGAGDESPFVVSLAAPATVSRYRVSFRTDDGIVPHIDRRDDTAGGQEPAVTSSVVRQQ